MKSRLRFALLLPAAALLGCTFPSSTSNSTPPLTGAWQNWQIEAGTSITSPPNTYPSFIGAIQIQGTTVSATLVTVDSTTTSFQQAYTGIYTPSTGGVAFSPAGVVGGASLSFTLPSSPYTLTAVNGGINCGLCNNGMLFNGVGISIAPLTGTYVGTVTDSSSSSVSGAATVTLAQSAAPNSSGAFPLSGTITFPSGSGFGTVPLGGTVAGEAITLSDSSTAPNSPTVNVTATASPDGSQITITNLLYSNFGPGAVFIFTGTLTRQ